MQNYKINVVEYYNREEVIVSGNFYISDYGHVVLSTEQPLVYD